MFRWQLLQIIARLPQAGWYPALTEYTPKPRKKFPPLCDRKPDLSALLCLWSGGFQRAAYA
jgi:hypothetical protein